MMMTMVATIMTTVACQKAFSLFVSSFRLGTSLLEWMSEEANERKNE
jgi:hypothetical protein